MTGPVEVNALRTDDSNLAIIRRVLNLSQIECSSPAKIRSEFF
jgi:hypothetical protein